MIIVDNALKKREADGNPIKVGLIGTGFMGGGIIHQIENFTLGMRIAAVSNRDVSKAIDKLAASGVTQTKTVSHQSELEAAIEIGICAVTDDPDLLCATQNIDVLIDATGAVEFGARITLSAIENGMPLVSLNAEMDGTVGPILAQKAKQAGVILTGCDGDQPGVQMNLFRFVKSMGMEPLLCGNIKGLQDPYRTPETQAGFAKQWGQSPLMVTSFADGTKISFEQAIVANATGMTVSKRGMSGKDFSGHVDALTEVFDIDELREFGGIVDYVVGAKPAPGVFILCAQSDTKQQEFLNLYKLGEGPLYCFYRPYHLCHFEVPNSVARAALFSDAVIAPKNSPIVEVIATAKRDLKAGEVVDGIGGFMTYGEAEKASTTASESLLPIGIAEGCRLLRDIPKDQALTYCDVEIPKGRLIDQLRNEQKNMIG